MKKQADAKPGRPLDVAKIVWEVEGLWSEWEAWIHRETGEVLVLTEVSEDEDVARIDDLNDEDKLIRIDRNPWDDWNRVERFVARLPDGDDARRIADAVQRRGRGRWARFKDALAEAELIEDWYEFRLAAVRTEVIAMLESEGIPYHEGEGDGPR